MMNIVRVCVFIAATCFIHAVIIPLEISDSTKRCLKSAPRLKNGYIAAPSQLLHVLCSPSGGTSQPDKRLLIPHKIFVYIRSFLKKILEGTGDKKRIRKEYRLLTDEERNTLHRAVKKLQDNGVADGLGKFHYSRISQSGGPPVTQWHRLYTLLYEDLLAVEEPSVILPYWASFWDHEMENPADSIVWNENWAGTGLGAVNDGFQANYQFLNEPLVRNVGDSGSLITQKAIDNVLKNDRLYLISPPYAKGTFSNLVNLHQAVHMYVGGSMVDPGRSTMDFLFTLHHVFVDCLFQNFIDNQIQKGINPETDWYPMYKPIGNPNTTVDFFGFQIPQIQLSKLSFSRAEYHPNCIKLLSCNRTNKCPSKYLECDLTRSICISIKSTPTKSECCTQNNGYSLGKKELSKNDQNTKRGGKDLAIQQLYGTNATISGSKYIAYLPIIIHTFRSPDRQMYNSFPVENGKIKSGNDVLKDGMFNKLLKETLDRQSSVHKDCRCRSTTGGLFIGAYNSLAHSRKFLAVDHRFPISSVIHYVQVKNPAYGATPAEIQVWDECGRRCRPRCKHPGSEEFSDCYGYVNITKDNEPNLSYAATIDESFNLVYHMNQLENKRFSPTFDDTKIKIAFDCDFRFTWPYKLKAKRWYDFKEVTGDLNYPLPPYNTIY